MKIAEGSRYEIIVREFQALVQIISQNSGEGVLIHIDDIPELIKELKRISKDENM